MEEQKPVPGQVERFYAVVRRRDGRVVGLLHEVSEAAVVAARLSRGDEHYVREATACIVAIEDKWHF